MKKVIVRDAEEKDLDRLVELLAQLFSIEVDFNFDPQQQKRGLDLLLKSRGQARIRVAEVTCKTGTGVTVVAMYSMQKLISTAEGGPVGLVEDVVVDQAWRGKGLGRQLLADAEKYAQEQGWHRLQLAADMQNTRALEFYRSHGWQQTQLVFLHSKPDK